MSASVKPLPPPKPPLLVKLSHTDYRRNGKSINITDKMIEELVLDELYYDIVHNLPADDIAMLMDQDKLLTLRQRDHYRMMKANHQPDVEKSEYLIECLRKGKPGFLQRLCTILKTLPPSSYIADKIQGKFKEIYTSSTPLMVNQQRHADGVSKVKSNVEWKTEYRKLEVKTRMQLQAKDKEIKRLRKVVRQLEVEKREHDDQLLSEMRAQVDNVAKWIDLKSKAIPHSSSLVKLALSRDLYSSFESQLSSTSEDVDSSNQSTMERRPKRKASFDSYLRDSPCTPSSCESSVATPTHERKDHTLADCSDLMIHLFMKNVSNPPSSIESDLSDIGRPLQEEESTHTTVTQRDSSESDLYIIDPSIPRNTPGIRGGHGGLEFSDGKSTLATTYYVHACDMNASPLTKDADMSGDTATSSIVNHASALGGMATANTEDTHMPSKGNSNVNSFESSVRCCQTQWKCVHTNESKFQQKQEPMADLITVFKRIQRKDFITSQL